MLCANARFFLDRTLKVANQAFQKGNPAGMVVEAGDQLKFAAAGGQKRFAAPDADFLQGFEAVGHERRADDEQPLRPGRGEPREFMVGVGLQPRIAAEPRLEGDGIIALGYQQSVGQRVRGPETLGAVAGGVGGTGDFATVLRLQAMTACGVGLP